MSLKKRIETERAAQNLEKNNKNFLERKQRLIRNLQMKD